MTIRNGKPFYVRLAKMAPGTHDHNVVVKILEKKTVVDKTSKDGRKLLEELVLVGDNTGCINFSARDGQCEKLVPGKVVALHNAKVGLLNNNMRLSLDKWGSISDTTIALPGEINTDLNFSEVVYDLVPESAGSSKRR